MATTSADPSCPLESHIITASNPISPTLFQQIANRGGLSEISNSSGAVRHYIYWQGIGNRKKRDKTDDTTFKPLMFYIYQTTRHGPQNGFRLCLVQQGFHITSPTKAEGDEEDDIDRLEKEIPQGHMEVVFVGPKPTGSDECEEESCEEDTCEED